MKKKIFIGSEESDTSTNEVCKWIQYYGHEYIRVNIEDSLSVSSIVITNNNLDVSFTHNENTFRLSEIKSFWYRRGGLSIKPIKIVFGNTFNATESGVSELIRNVNSELGRIESFYRYFFEHSNDIKILGNPTNSTNNKLTHLSIATKHGLRIPDTYVVTTSADIKYILSKNDKKYVVKPISDSPNVINNLTDNDKDYYMLYTNEISMDDLKYLPQNFPPSLIQEKIEKKFEIRIFFMNDAFYPMAIFSQSDTKTNLDFRRYNHAFPNRAVPIKLDKMLLNNLKSFSMECGLNTGSFDILYSTTNEYYFLEINPVGQFGMVSMPCNYYIEKIIAEYLCI